MIDHYRINNTMGKMFYHLSNHNCICVSVSGGSDSNIIVHMIATHFREFLPKIHFVFSNTGLEYEATKKHLDYMEKRYNIKIDKIRGMPIPYAVRKYGMPFVSKTASEFLGRLQKHNFQWEDSDLENLDKKYPKMHAALRYWCNDWGEKSRYNISWNKQLKDFLMEKQAEFQISAMCCQKSKKDPLIKYQSEIGADLSITGERKAEGGSRASKGSCFENSHGVDHYMPLFYWNDETKQWYKEREEIVYSDCYEVWGMKRTGCVGCPFAQGIKEELEIIAKYEPKLYKACMNIFGKSYKLMDEFEVYRHKISK